MLSNPLTYPKKSRALTLGERQIAQSVFGNHLKLDDIRLKTAWWVLKGYAVSPNGHIYFHPDDWLDDVSCETLHKRAWLVHELVHVWQVQQGLAVFWRALFNRKYRYLLTDHKAFLRYGIEQQASIVEDYYIRRELGQECSDYVACVPFLPKPI